MKYSEFYLAFEDKFRGSSVDVQEKLVFYDGLLDEIMLRFSNCNLLDIGSGRGEWLQKCTDLGINSIGIDNNESMVNLCLGKSLNIKYGEALDILKTFKNDSFHIISCFHFIEHISFDMLLEILEHCKRILIPGGALILETPSIDNILTSAKDFYLDPTHKTHIHPETVIFALDYFKFTESKYFLINSSTCQKYAYDSINNVVNGAGLDVSIISSYTINKKQISLFDKSLFWVNDLKTAKNTFEVCNLYDALINEKIDKTSLKIDSLVRQVDHFFYVYEKIRSFPIKLSRKIQSCIHFTKAIAFKIIKLFLSKILRVYWLEKIYFKISRLLFNNKLDVIVNTKHDNYLTKFFQSNPRSKDILSDIQSKLRS